MPKFFAATAILALAAVGTADAQVTPRQVWDDWVATIETGDATLTTGSIEEDGDGLTVSGLEMRAGGEDDGYALSLDQVRLEQNDDGSVAVTLSPSYPVTLTGETEDGEATEIEFMVSHPDLKMTVSDEGAVRRHAYEAPELSVALVRATEGAEPLDLDATLGLGGVTGVYEVTEDGQGDSRLVAETLSFETEGTDPADETGSFGFSLRMTEVEAEGVTSFLDHRMERLAESLEEGAERSASVRYGASTSTLTSENEDGQVTIESATDSGEIAARLSQDGLSYTASNSDSVVNISGDAVPLPQLRLTMAENAVDLHLPVLAAEGPQGYDLEMRLRELTLDESLWSMIDPAGLLPREPATLVIDLSGDATLERNVLEADTDDTPPGTIDTLSLDELRLSLAGAELLGTGALDFPQGGADGMTRPEGAIELTLTGGNALLDRLVQMGMIPEDQAMGARMMLSLFARQGEGEDTLETTIRFTEDGQVLVNDQRIR